MKNKIKEIKNIARLDIYRDKRCGIPEAILAEHKDPKWTAKFLVEMVKARGSAIATRVDINCFQALKKNVPAKFKLKYYDKAKVVTLNPVRKIFSNPVRNFVHKDSEIGISNGANGTGFSNGVNKSNLKLPIKTTKVGLLAAGTADIPVAEEARVTMEFLGGKVFFAYDVGIAGIHRLFSPLEQMLKEKVSCIVVVAGMEGALPTVVKSLVDIPVIGVPTSTGYGYGGKGESALMTMLQSCSPGLVVVNIDNGFGAGAAAVLIARLPKCFERRAGPLRRSSARRAGTDSAHGAS